MSGLHAHTQEQSRVDLVVGETCVAGHWACTDCMWLGVVVQLWLLWEDSHQPWQGHATVLASLFLSPPTFCTLPCCLEKPTAQLAAHTTLWQMLPLSCGSSMHHRQWGSVALSCVVVLHGVVCTTAQFTVPTNTAAVVVGVSHWPCPLLLVG